MNADHARLLQQHFDTAFAAPDGIKKLRELILTLAMQGKLVPQDPNDPPASQLLKEIEAEKKRLVKAGKIKALKLPKEFEAQALPYRLPSGWQWVQLGMIGNIFNGNSINAAEKEAKYAGANGLPYIATKDVGYGLDLLDYENGIFIPETEKNFRIAHQGAVLICAEGGSAGKKCGLTDRDICFGNKLFASELFGAIPPRFIIYYYLSPIFRILFESSMTGIIGGVSIAKFFDLAVPLPPLNEQHRLITKIGQLFARCDELEELRTKHQKMRKAVNNAAINRLLDVHEKKTFFEDWHFLTQHFSDIYSVKNNVSELRKAILQLALMGKLSKQIEEDGSVERLMSRVQKEKQRLKFRQKNDPIQTRLEHDIPSNWKWHCLDDLLVFGPTNGFSPKAVDYETRVRSLTLSATTSGTFKGEHSKFIDADIPLDSDLWLSDGDILVQRGNSLEYVGVAAIYRGEPGLYIYPDLMMKLRISRELDTDFIYFAMCSIPSRDFLRARASGTSGTMPKINQKTLMSLPIPVPPLAEQQRIVHKITQLMGLCDKLEEKIDDITRKQTELLNAITS